MSEISRGGSESSCYIDQRQEGEAVKAVFINKNLSKQCYSQKFKKQNSPLDCFDTSERLVNALYENPDKTTPKPQNNWQYYNADPQVEYKI